MASDAVSVPPQKKYEVFVNFRGEDTRDNFTSHLKEALDRNGINAFTDTGLQAGDEISTKLDTKITESLVSVVVFSPNYADSRWCLDELVRIMECKDSHGQIVMPVFVQKVEPTHVRNQTGTFGVGFKRLIRGARYADRKASWELALKQAADLSGLASDQMSEGDIVEKLINRVQSVLSKKSSAVLDECFVVTKNVEIVESSMFASEQQWRCIGLWGMGGLGKTTLAKEIQNRVSNQFEGSCFIENVGELAERGELDDVYWKRMSQLLKMNDANQDVPSIRRKLARTKVLIVLDDVSGVGQCQELIKNRESHHSESKIIAISRDKQILKNIGCDEIYQVQALDDHEALQLLKYHILKQREPTPDQVELLKDAIKYTGGLPLALVVLGRILFDKDITIWKSELAKFGDKPNSCIMKILKASFDGLEEDEKDIFLDIACVMEGWDKYDVERILNACEFYAISGIDRLVDKALLTISDDDDIHMHDLLRQMGKQIAAGSRLCGEKEIADILTRRSRGREMERKIEVMSMELNFHTRMELSPGAFNEMTRLRVLCFRTLSDEIYSDTIYFKEGLEYLPDGLRYLQWEQYPEQSLPPRFNPVNLVELRMKSSNLRQLWTDEIEPCLPSLKLVDLSYSKKLTTVPDFRNALKLEILDLSYSENLEDIPDLSHLTKLVVLDLMGCSEVRILRQLPPSLIKLDLRCTKIKKLENTSIQGLSLLEHLHLYGCKKLESLPDKICALKNLGALDLQGCPSLSILPSFQMPIVIQGGSSPSENLPAARDGLRSLTRLYLERCKAETLPCLKSLVSLEELYVKRSNVKSLPEDIKCLTNLWKIDVSECKNLRCIPELPPSLLYLDVSMCTSLQKYTHIQSAELDLSQTNISRNYGRGRRMHMMFTNCFSLEKEARNAIWRDLRLRNESIFIPSLERESNESWTWYSVGACTPGNEVPEWFKYSDTRSSSIEVYSKRLRPNGLYFFVVLCIPTDRRSWGWSPEVTCEGYSKSGQTFDCSCHFDCSWNDINKEHTIVWYHHLGSHNNRFDLNGSTFLFSTRGLNSDCIIVKCGVTPFYNSEHEGDNNHGFDDGNDDDDDIDYNNKVRQRGSSSSIHLAEEEPGGTCGLDLNFPIPAEEGQGASGFDLNFSAPVEDELDLDLRLAPPAEERASLVDRSQKGKLESLPCGIICLKNLKELNLGGCLKLLPGRKQALYMDAPSSRFPVTGFHAEFFVEIELFGCSINEHAWLGRQRFGSLRVVSFSNSNLKKLPDLSEARQARRLVLQGCINLVDISSIQYLVKLEHLDLKGCTRLTGLPSIMHLENLISIDLSYCRNLKRLRPSLGCLKRLAYLNLSNCKRLENLPISTFTVKSIQSLDISGCSLLIMRASEA